MFCIYSAFCHLWLVNMCTKQVFALSFAMKSHTHICNFFPDNTDFAKQPAKENISLKDAEVQLLSHFFNIYCNTTAGSWMKVKLAHRRKKLSYHTCIVHESKRDSIFSADQVGSRPVKNQSAFQSNSIKTQFLYMYKNIYIKNCIIIQTCINNIKI